MNTGIGKGLTSEINLNQSIRQGCNQHYLIST